MRKIISHHIQKSISYLPENVSSKIYRIHQLSVNSKQLAGRLRLQSNKQYPFLGIFNQLEPNLLLERQNFKPSGLLERADIKVLILNNFLCYK